VFIFSILVYDGAKRIWLETAMRLRRLQYLIFSTTCRYQPPLRAGKFFYDYETSREYEMEDEIIEFAATAVEKFTADPLVPFQIRISSPTLGP
jgi:hypothetical protein